MDQMAARLALPANHFEVTQETIYVDDRAANKQAMRRQVFLIQTSANQAKPLAVQLIVVLNKPTNINMQMMLVRPILANTTSPTRFDEIAGSTHEQKVIFFTRFLGQEMIPQGQKLRVSGPPDFTLHECEFK